MLTRMQGDTVSISTRKQQAARLIRDDEQRLFLNDNSISRGVNSEYYCCFSINVNLSSLFLLEIFFNNIL